MARQSQYRVRGRPPIDVRQHVVAITNAQAWQPEQVTPTDSPSIGISVSVQNCPVCGTPSQTSLGLKQATDMANYLAQLLDYSEAERRAVWSLLLGMRPARGLHH